MRRTVIALAAMAGLLAACQNPDEVKSAPPVEDAPPVMPADAPPQEEVGPAPAPSPADPTAEGCLGEVGAAASARLVERCIAVSPATRPPCNAANPCAMIQGEIDRSCQGYPADAARPAECDA